ncbi:citrate synthase/methylcitrate synthase [Acanthopleuribacter pedis]|uniref:Citrate synthase n=1 Tax=Acanthopleuribacter pedis TaxID=442870 RepID=A0A8J7U4Y3_9BACT|nr:citrate synthase/methylcitrate synthase [Acanthopleuribacter pedis]MBO1320264.1 citrate synthase/methylcitrate synthase [Acanthopleuribacter pedis]
MSLSPAPTFSPGLEGVIACETQLSFVDGRQGILLLRGYPLESFARAARFEEAAYLFWYGRRPDPTQAAEFAQRWADHRVVDADLLNQIAAAARRGMPAMDALRMGAAAVHLDAAQSQDMILGAQRITAALPTILAAYLRARDGLAPVEPRRDLGHAANFLWMLSGEEPDPAKARALETYWNTVIDHGLNASTFTARVIISTGSDLVSAVTGAIGALKGPLHGGAPGPALDMVFEIGSAENAEPFLRAKLAAGERIMGFGHRVYKVRDPRAEVLGQAARELADAGSDQALYDLAITVEETALRLLAEFKPDRKLYTNVEFYTALLLHAVGFKPDAFAPLFALGRAVGWCAHGMEQAAEGRLIRPKAHFTGTRRDWET